MRTVTAMLGTRPGGRTFVLLMLQNEKARDAFLAMVKGMQGRRTMPADAFAIASDLSGHGGEVVLVIPPSDNAGVILRDLTTECAMRLNIQLARGDMTLAAYVGYNLIAEVALAEKRRLDN